MFNKQKDTLKKLFFFFLENKDESLASVGDLLTFHCSHVRGGFL